MIYKHLTTNRGDPIYQKGETNYPAASFRVWSCGAIMRKVVLPVFLLFLFVAALPFLGYAAGPTYPITPSVVQTTRDRTVSPVSIPGAIELTLDKVEQYAPNGYSSWQWDYDGADAGPLLLDGSTAEEPTPVETLLSFFSMSDIHIVDKESPAQAIYGAFISPSGFGETNTSAYSPIMLSTTHVLDAAVQTINKNSPRVPLKIKGKGVFDKPIA